MNPTSLSLILSALSHSRDLVPDEADRDVFKAAADAATRTSRNVEVIIVAGPNVDPVVDEVQQMGEHLDTMRDAIDGIRDHVDDLLRVMRQRRHDATASGQSPHDSGVSQ